MTRRLIVLLALLPLPAFAQGVQKPEMVPYYNGTGFYVSRDGYLVTNNHVVESCLDITVSGAVPESKAELIARDTANDLALLRTDARPADAAKLRSDYFPPLAAEEVVTVGYPENQGLTTSESRIEGLKGPKGEASRLQFTDRVKHGNSGGALLDQSGNVIGVVVGKNERYQENKESKERTFIDSTGIAIAPATLKFFLDSQRVEYRDANSGNIMSASSLERRAKDFTVQVKCRLDPKQAPLS